MLIRSLPLAQILVVILVFFSPVSARCEEQTQQAEPQAAEKAADEANLKPAEPATGQTPSQGIVIIPSAQNTEPGPEDSPVAPGPTAPEKGSERVYIIKRGDTLWDISHAFLKDPFLWPFIWKANPYIVNADLIYPGNKLIIPDLAPVERAMAAPPARHPEQAKAAPAMQPSAEPKKQAPEEHANRIILPEEKPLPLVDRYSMLTAGFVSREESAGRIVGSEEGKTIFGFDDVVYVRLAKKADIGDKFIMYEPLNNVKHPVTGARYGRLTRVLGVLEIAGKGRKDAYTARIVYSADAADRNSLLTPYEEPSLIYSGSDGKKKDLKGCILEVVDGRTINGQIDVVYLDKGSSDGVEAGDRFLVYSRPQKKIYPRKLIGEVQVFLVKEDTATAIVRRSNDTIAKGDPIELKQ